MKKGGTIINMSGAFGEAEAGCISDFLAKKGMDNFTKALDLELKDKKINSYSIAPWYVWTEGVKKFYPECKDESLMPEDVAEVVYKLIIGKTKHKSSDRIVIREEEK